MFKSTARISNCFMINPVFKNYKLNFNKNHYIEVTFVDDYNTVEILTLSFVSEQELTEAISFVNNFIEKDFTCKSRE